MFGPWVLNEIWMTGISSALIGMFMSSSKLFLFSKEVHLNSGVRLIGIVLCCCHQARCVLYYWVKLTVAFICTSLPLNLYTYVFGCIWTKILTDRRIWRKKGTDRRISIPIFSPLKKHWWIF